MFTLVSFSEEGYSILHQSNSFEELDSLRNDPSRLSLDALVLHERSPFLSEESEVCGSIVMEEDELIEDEEFESFSEFFILDSDFLEPDEDKTFCELLLEKYPHPHMLREDLRHTAVA